MSKTFYYIVHATTGDNVSSIDAADEKEAKQKLAEIYGDIIHSPKVDTLSAEFITKARHDSEKKRIDTDRQTEANAVDPAPES
jgi:hypothetical protein